MATAILNKLFETEVVRTRDTKVLEKLDIVYDVGGGEFDHHGVEKEYRENGTPFAACGLIWEKYGRNIIYKEDQSLTKDDIESVFDYVDRFLIEGIDAQDNGMRTGEETIPTMDISNIIAGYNPPWYSEENEEELFHEAVKVCEPILNNTITRKLSVIKAKDIVISAYNNRKRSEFLVLDKYCPWQETIQEIDEQGKVLFVIYPNKDNYAIQTIRDKDGETRKYLPKSWAGKENEELAAITGIEDSVFCHTGRFIAVAGTFEGIMKMAQIAMDGNEE
jgi:uncharacterized UPF0160 family protein